MLLFALLLRKPRARTGAASIKNGPLSRDGNSYDILEEQTRSEQFRDGFGG